jgi:crotonobetainyl-CoA:carnitine CoA-transferase CaiB-like acyl-CoA transferase
MDRLAPLDGMLVVALEQAVAAPLCSCRLVDAGARVIKLERPEGDFARAYDRYAQGQSSYFVWLNRGKESAVVDLSQTADREWTRRLIARADVFIENLAPGAAGRLGLDPADLRAANPRLVTCSIRGYSAAGPYATRKAYDLLVQAESGLASITGGPAEPSRVGVSVVDIATGLNAYSAILEALLARGRTGAGRHVEIALFDAVAEWMAVPLIQYEGTGTAPARVGLRHPSIAPYGVYACGDGAQFLVSIQNAREWQRWAVEVLEAPELLADPRFVDNTARVAHRAELDAVIAARLAMLSGETLRQRLELASIAYGQLNDVGGFGGHPHLRRLEVATAGGTVSVPAPPLARPLGEAQLTVPAIGEHSEALRREFP